VCFAGTGDETSNSNIPFRIRDDDIVLRKSPLNFPSVVSILLGKTAMARSYVSSAMREKIDRVLATDNYDLLHVMCSYLIDNVRTSIPILLDEPNIESLTLNEVSKSRYAFGIRGILDRESSSFKSMENRAYSRAITVAIPSEYDAGFYATSVKSKLKIVPNGIDTRLWRPRGTAKSDTPTIIFSGNFRFLPNIDAALFLIHIVLPIIQRQMPDVSLRIVGHASIEMLGWVRRRSNVHVLGYVADLQSEIERAWVFAAPVRAGVGTRIKLLESLTVGTPIVATQRACAGLGLVAEESVVVADAATMADAIVQLLKDGSRRQRIARMGRELVARNLDWNSAADRLQEAYARIGVRKSPRTEESRLISGHR
jgi:glycosyltransferase involved in cell wall biosynthesis